MLFLAKMQEVDLQEKTVIRIIHKNILLMIEWILENTLNLEEPQYHTKHGWAGFWVQDKRMWRKIRVGLKTKQNQSICPEHSEGYLPAGLWNNLSFAKRKLPLCKAAMAASRSSAPQIMRFCPSCFWGHPVVMTWPSITRVQSPEKSSVGGQEEGPCDLSCFFELSSSAGAAAYQSSSTLKGFFCLL